MSNPDAYRTKIYLLADPASRLYNGKIYSSQQVSDDFIFRALSDDDIRAYVITEICHMGFNVNIDKKLEWYRDAQGSYHEPYFEIISNINPNKRWSSDCDILDYGNVGQYVMRRKSSEFWKEFDPHKCYKIIEYDRNCGLLYLCDAKDEYGNDIANLAEYDRLFPGEIQIVSEDEMPINEPTRKKHLIVCYDDDGFKLY
jgi:hypothetical protein